MALFVTRPNALFVATRINISPRFSLAEHASDHPLPQLLYMTDNDALGGGFGEPPLP